MRTRTLITAIALALLAAACGGTDDTSPDLGGPGDGDATEDGAGEGGTGEDGTDEDGAGDGEDLGDAEAAARELLGLPEDEVVEDAETRIMRRGDEQMAGTMDLRPGRRNVELDEVDGQFVVTRVVIETEDGENIVVE